MAKPKARWWESGLNLGFAGTVAAGLVLAFLIYLIGLVPVLAWLLSAWHWLVQPVGVPLVLLAAMLLVLALVAVAFVQKTREPPPPAWLTYREDSFLGIVWRWNYAGNTIAHGSVRPYCPQCGIALRAEQHGYSGMTTHFVCDECHFALELRGSVDDVIDRIGRLVEGKVNLKTTP